MKAFRVILISAALILLLLFSVNSLVGEERYLTLDGTVKSIERKWWMEVESGKDSTSIRFRIGWRTVYSPHRYPQPGERVKVDYLIQKGTPTAYTVTIFEREVPKEVSKEIPPTVIQKQEEIEIKKPAPSSESQVAERGRIVSPAPKKKQEQPKPVEHKDKKIEPKLTEQTEILEKPIEPSQLAKTEEPPKVETPPASVKQTKSIAKPTKTIVTEAKKAPEPKRTGIGGLIIYLIPLIVGALVGSVTHWGKTSSFVNGINKFDEWVIRKRNDLKNQVGKGKIKRYWAMPILWILNGIITLSGTIQNEAIRSGVKTTAYLYLLGTVAIITFYAVAIIVGIIITIIILWIVGLILGWNDGEVTEKAVNSYAKRQANKGEERKESKWPWKDKKVIIGQGTVREKGWLGETKVGHVAKNEIHKEGIIFSEKVGKIKEEESFLEGRKAAAISDKDGKEIGKIKETWLGDKVIVDEDGKVIGEYKDKK